MASSDPKAASGEGFEAIAREHMQRLIAKFATAPDGMRELCESLILIGFTAGACWALDIDPKLWLERADAIKH